MAVSGTLESPLPDEWHARADTWRKTHGSVHMFTLRPRIRAGDRLVMYASGTPSRLGAGRIFAVRAVVADPEPSTHDRWPWQVAVHEVISGPDLPHCPTINQIGVEPKSLRRHTHIKLAHDAGVRAEELIEGSAAALASGLRKRRRTRVPHQTAALCLPSRHTPDVVDVSSMKLRKELAFLLTARRGTPLRCRGYRSR